MESLLTLSWLTLSSTIITSLSYMIFLPLMMLILYLMEICYEIYTYSHSNMKNRNNISCWIVHDILLFLELSGKINSQHIFCVIWHGSLHSELVFYWISWQRLRYSFALLLNYSIEAYFDSFIYILLLQLRIIFSSEFFINTIAAKRPWPEVDVMD